MITMWQLSKRDTFSCATFLHFLKCLEKVLQVVEFPAAEVQLCNVTNMYGTCELKRGVCVCVSVSVWLCVTDLRRWTWVMMFTTLFHHLSPHNTWNPWNYISLAISCKIFTFSSLIFPPRFLAGRSRPSHESAHVHTHIRAQRPIHRALRTPFSHLRCPSFFCEPERGRNWGEAERRKRRCVEEWGGMV